MWVHTRIAFSAILLLTFASGQTVAKKVRSPSKPKTGVAKRILEVAKKVPGTLDGISSHDLQSIIDGSNMVIKGFKKGQRWFKFFRSRGGVVLS